MFPLSSLPPYLPTSLTSLPPYLPPYQPRARGARTRSRGGLRVNKRCRHTFATHRRAQRAARGRYDRSRYARTRSRRGRISYSQHVSRRRVVRDGGDKVFARSLDKTNRHTCAASRAPVRTARGAVRDDEATKFLHDHSPRQIGTQAPLGEATRFLHDHSPRQIGRHTSAAWRAPVRTWLHTQTTRHEINVDLSTRSVLPLGMNEARVGGGYPRSPPTAADCYTARGVAPGRGEPLLAVTPGFAEYLSSARTYRAR